MDYYKILGISPASSKQSIKKAYHRLASQYHPDKNPHTAEKFKQITEAYIILSDKEQKKQYDNQRKCEKADFKKNTTSFSHNTFHTQREFKTKDPYPSLDIHTQLSLTLEEAHLGLKKTITLNINNNGRIEKKKIPIKIPKGIREGKSLKFKNYGHQAQGQKGHLFINIQIKKHPLFRLYDNNLILSLPISVSDAILGKEVTIPTLSSSAKVKIPPNSHSGDLLKLKNLGFFEENSFSRGDLILEICIDIPEQITEEEKTWFSQFRKNKPLPPSVAQFNIQTRKLITKKAS